MKGAVHVIVRLLVWAAVACVGLLAVSQATTRGSSFPLVYIGQALSPYLFALMVPVALAALWQRELLLGLTAAAVSLPLLVVSGPLIRPTPLPDPTGPTVTVLSSNIWWRNGDLAAAVSTVLGADADVIVISELTDDIDDALTAAGVDESYPHRAGTPDNWSKGLGLWSRYPVISSRLLPVEGRTTVEAVIDVDGTAVRIIGAHPSQPISPEGRDTWKPALRQITEIALDPSAPPTVVVGDMNASWWHPPYRQMVAAGLVDVHNALGDVLSASWPANGRHNSPSFVRIDRALLTPGMTATAIDDLDVPGSDHVAFVVTVAVSR